MGRILGFEVIEKYIFSHSRKPQHRQLCQQKLPELVMHNPADILGLGTVLVVIQKPVIGRHTHIGKDGPVTAKMLEVHKIYPIIIQKGTGTDIEIQFAAHPKVEEMLNASFYQVKL
jgi:hypothetical protein